MYSLIENPERHATQRIRMPVCCRAMRWSHLPVGTSTGASCPSKSRSPQAGGYGATGLARSQGMVRPRSSAG